ncbi:hypothetical protein GEOBC_00787 [Geobacteraceae bacterium]|nr:hypothetical protein GEOBC_00787 [Geobacteraceae bacterium]
MLLAAIGFLVCVELGRALLFNAKRLRLAIGLIESTVPNQDIVLYLRAFTDDVRARATAEFGGMPFSSLVTEEEQIRKAVEPIGGLVAIGKPGEPLPELGAAREYVDNTHWKARVQDLIDQSALVLIRVGSSPGIAWEINEAFSRKPSSSIVLLLSMTPDEYSKSKGALSLATSTTLPEWKESNGNSWPLKAIVTFNKEAVGALTPLCPQSNRWEPLTPAIRTAIRSVCETNGLPWATPHGQIWYSVRTFEYILAFAFALVLLARSCGSNAP